jgi:hypothetical protein
MSVVGCYVALTDAELRPLLGNVEEARRYLRGCDSPLYVDKSWHMVHFLLTGRSQGGEGPLARVVMGGGKLIPYDDPSLDSPAWFLTAEQVRESASALSHLDPEGLWSKIDRDTLYDAGIYPGYDPDDPEDRKYVLGYLREIVMFFQSAASSGSAVIFSAG